MQLKSITVLKISPTILLKIRQVFLLLYLADTCLSKCRIKILDSTLQRAVQNASVSICSSDGEFSENFLPGKKSQKTIRHDI